ncbi:Histone-lysine N-methyltransferase SETMAR [Eumeta japonica]|uniref:Histone-lysine N-methyltransferase SETMAR n=1 Tax=Eumeta variegata TaxID=151549 RepID=A0A4C1X7R3_EUMVA|nr:Histone-lysine N-methyltransferase SETMAR [Eumeta japonica]
MKRSDHAWSTVVTSGWGSPMSTSASRLHVTPNVSNRRRPCRIGPTQTVDLTERCTVPANILNRLNLATNSVAITSALNNYSILLLIWNFAIVSFAKNIIITISMGGITASFIRNFLPEFRCGRTSTSDAERSGRPKEVITPEIVDKIHEMILDDRRMKVRELAHAVGISTERVHHILHEYLDIRKLSPRWVSRLLTLDHKRNRVTTSKECLAMFSRNPDEFLRRFVTVDETWIHHNTPETKEQSKQWVSRGERGPRKAKQSLSANKAMATVFWDARGVIHIDYLEKGKTITGEYYSKLLDRFDVD